MLPIQQRNFHCANPLEFPHESEAANTKPPCDQYLRLYLKFKTEQAERKQREWKFNRRKRMSILCKDKIKTRE